MLHDFMVVKHRKGLCLMIKIDIISGFLGAGKTTLIKKLLTVFSTDKKKVVLIENEFGKIGIDGEIIQREGIEVYEISQGCICCSMKNDFLNTLTEILEKNKTGDNDFDTFGLKTSKIFNETQLVSLLTDLKNKQYGKILRGKGFLRSKHGFFQISYVNGQFSISLDNIESKGRISFIGQNLNKQKLYDAFVEV